MRGHLKMMDVAQRSKSPADFATGGAQLSVAQVTLLALAHCAAFADRNLPAVAAPLLKREMHLSDAQLGLLMGPAFAVLYVLGMLLTLPLTASPQRFRWLAGCIALWGLGMLAFALAPTFQMLLAARALVGLGQAAFVPLALGVIVDGVAGSWRARSIAVFTAGSAIGRSLALLLGGATLTALAHWHGATPFSDWRLMFLLMAAPNGLLIVLLLRCRESVRPVADTPASLRDLRSWLRRWPKPFACYLGAAGAAVLVVQTVGAWAPSVLYREHALAPGQAALAFGVMLLVAAPLGHGLAGVLVDSHRARFAPMSITALGLVMVVPLLGLMWMLEPVWLACAALALASLVGGTAAVAALAGLPAMLPEPLRALAIRLFMVFITLVGVGLGPYLAGLVSDHRTAGPHALSSALWMVCAGAATVGIVSALGARRGWHRMAAAVAG